MTTHQNRSTDMNTMHEAMARAQMVARLGEAQQLRRGHQLTMARRLGKKAEQAAQQASLALARTL
ncbi:MAG: hypothetical protein ABIO16_14635 [Nocardioides sp.]